MNSRRSDNIVTVLDNPIFLDESDTYSSGTIQLDANSAYSSGVIHASVRNNFSFGHRADRSIFDLGIMYLDWNDQYDV